MPGFVEFKGDVLKLDFNALEAGKVIESVTTGGSTADGVSTSNAVVMFKQSDPIRSPKQDGEHKIGKLEINLKGKTSSYDATHLADVATEALGGYKSAVWANEQAVATALAKFTQKSGHAPSPEEAEKAMVPLANELKAQYLESLIKKYDPDKSDDGKPSPGAIEHNKQGKTTNVGQGF